MAIHSWPGLASLKHDHAPLPQSTPILANIYCETRRDCSPGVYDSLYGAKRGIVYRQPLNHADIEVVKSLPDEATTNEADVLCLYFLC